MDAVLPTLDAGNDALFRAINRPHPDVTFASFCRGLAKFRQSYKGLLWLEVMLVDGMNATERALAEIAALTAQIGPDEIHVSIPFRASAEARKCSFGLANPLTSVTVRLIQS